MKGDALNGDAPKPKGDGVAGAPKGAFELGVASRPTNTDEGTAELDTEEPLKPPVGDVEVNGANERLAESLAEAE